MARRDAHEASKGARIVTIGACAWLVSNVLVLGGLALLVIGFILFTTGAVGAGGPTDLGLALTSDGAFLGALVSGGVAGVLVGVGYLVYRSGLSWVDPSTGQRDGLSDATQSKAITAAVLFIAYGALAFIVLALFLTATGDTIVIGGFLAWFVAAILLVFAASSHRRFLDNVQYGTGYAQETGGKSLLTYAIVNLIGILLNLGAFGALVVAFGARTTEGAGAALILLLVAGVVEFLALPIFGFAVFIRMIRNSRRLRWVGQPHRAVVIPPTPTPAALPFAPIRTEGTPYAPSLPPVMPEAQPASQPPGQYFPYPHAPPPSQPSDKRIAILLVIAVFAVGIVIVIAAIANHPVQKAAGSPAITASNFNYAESNCTGMPSVTFHLTLTNTGDADASVTVNFYANESIIGGAGMIVPQRDSVDMNATPTGHACTHSYTYEIASVLKV